MLVIGLTGGIATGKSTASSAFRAQGITVIDADAIAHRVMEPGQVSYNLVVRHFGPSVLRDDGSGEIDRAKLGSIIFGDVEKRQVLNQCTHPYVRRRILGQVARCYLGGARVCVVDVPLLFEAGLHRICGKTVVVSCTEEQQIERLARRNGLGPEEARARVDAQMPVAEKARRADRVLDNSGEIQDLEKKVVCLVDEWTPSALRTWAALLAPVGVVASLPFALGQSAWGIGTLCACAAWVVGSLAGL